MKNQKYVLKEQGIEEIAELERYGPGEIDVQAEIAWVKAGRPMPEPEPDNRTDEERIGSEEQWLRIGRTRPETVEEAERIRSEFDFMEGMIFDKGPEPIA